jgi:hypothetical protein
MGPGSEAARPHTQPQKYVCEYLNISKIGWNLFFVKKKFGKKFYQGDVNQRVPLFVTLTNKERRL